MKMFVLTYVDELTRNYHPEGGLVVVANDEEHAKNLILNHAEVVEVTQEEWDKAIVYDLEGEPEPRVFVFPDAGCC